MRKLIFVLAVLMVVFGLVIGGAKLVGDSAEVEMVKTSAEQAVLPIPITGTPPTATVEPTLSVLTPYVLPVEEPLTNGFLFNKTVDLSSGLPTALSILVDNETLVASNWAGALAYHEDDDQEQVFAPGKGVIYSYQGDITTTWAHSGINVYGQRYFATNLELFIRKNAENQILSFSEATEKMRSLIGKTAYLCQGEAGEVSFLSDYDPTKPCSGKMIELEIVAAVLVPHEDLEAYDEAIVEINGWLTKQYPDSGFESLSQENGWILRFCIGKLSDQTSDGTPGYLYNRGILGFVIRE